MICLLGRNEWLHTGICSCCFVFSFLCVCQDENEDEHDDDNDVDEGIELGEGCEDSSVCESSEAEGAEQHLANGETSINHNVSMRKWMPGEVLTVSTAICALNAMFKRKL